MENNTRQNSSSASSEISGCQSKSNQWYPSQTVTKMRQTKNDARYNNSPIPQLGFKPPLQNTAKEKFFCNRRGNNRRSNDQAYRPD